jgi:hypothetical protein
MRNGSFGIYAKNKNADANTCINIWFCGKGRNSIVISNHCAHATKREAINCARGN